MLSRLRSLLIATLLTSLAVSASAQDYTTDAERLYREARRSDDRTTQLLADRWNNLVKLQTWTDTTGQFDVTAKYVEHDPKMKWVKLRAVKESDGKRVVKDLTVPLEKLDKTGQVRVRQIAFVRPKLEEAMAAAAQTDEQEGSKERGVMEEDQFGLLDERAPARGGRGGRPDVADPRGERGGPPPGPLPTSTASSTSSDQTAPVQQGESESTDLPPLSPDHPFMPDNDPWRTDYEKFRTVFERDEDGIIYTAQPWRGVRELQAAIPNEFLGQDPNDQTPKPFVESRRAQQIGDFVWAGTVATNPSPDANWAEVLALAPLPEPIKLELRVSHPGHAKAMQIMKPGDQLKFIGRFTGYKGAYIWVAEIMAFDANFGGDSTKPDGKKEEPAHPSNGGIPPAVMPDDAAWRTDYEAFRANISLDRSQRTTKVNWGELAALQEACDTVTKWESTGEVGDRALQEIAAKFAAVGEVEWQATLAEADTSAGDWTKRLALPPLADPLSIFFVLDEERPAGNWQKLNTGDRVRFIGRFVDFESGGDLIVAIRFPENQPAENQPTEEEQGPIRR